MPADDAAPARSLADQLRGWPDQRLAGLLRARPDLASPTPQNTAQIASRAAVRSSIVRALDGLDRLELTVLEATAVLGPLAPEELPVAAAPEAAAAALSRLVDLALVWESPEGLRALSGVRDALGPVHGLHPAGGLDPAQVGSRLEALTPEARTLLEHLDQHGGHGTTAAARPGGPSDTPAAELLAAGLLQARAEGLVTVPAEVALTLRGGRTTSEPVDVPPEIATSERDPTLVARAAAGTAFEAVRRVELLLDQWGTRPPPVLRSGGLAVRDLKAAATVLHTDETTAALVVEVASEAGLVAEAVTDGEPVWAPTEEFDRWAAASTASRWVELATAWLRSARTPAQVGRRDAGRGATNALSPDLTSPLQAETRRHALGVLTLVPPGQVLAAGTGVPSVVARMAWERPRRPAVREAMAGWALSEAAALGVTGLDGLPEASRRLLADDPEEAAAALAPLLPEPVDHVLLQADLTAVAPGPLTTELGRTLHLLADVESRGGATVYRFTPASVRRAFDAGWSAAEVHEAIAGVARTPVPQPLTYLVDDVARTFGTIRVGYAEAFLRADDEAALTELLHHAQAGPLGLRRIAPTVLVSTMPLDLLLPRLRELGAAPVVEAADGTVRVARPDLVRARRPRARHVPGRDAARDAAHLAAVVAAVRAGDRAEAARPARAPGPSSPAAALATLREAIESGHAVWIGYLDDHGATTERVVDPVAVDGGRLTAYDHRSEDTRTFAVHRITGVRPVARD